MNKLKLVFVLSLLVMLVAACGGDGSDGNNNGEQGQIAPSIPSGDTDPLIIEIHDMEKKAKMDSVMDRTVGLRLLKAYQDYYNKHPQVSLGIQYLFLAARVADAMGKYPKAVECLKNYHDVIPNAEKRAEAAYMIAFIYDAHMHDVANARTYYRRVIELYPESTWAVQSHDALPLLGKSDEELIRMFEQKNAN